MRVRRRAGRRAGELPCLVRSKCVSVFSRTPARGGSGTPCAIVNRQGGFAARWLRRREARPVSAARKWTSPVARVLVSRESRSESLESPRWRCMKTGRVSGTREPRGDGPAWMLAREHGPICIPVGGIERPRSSQGDRGVTDVGARARRLSSMQSGDMITFRAQLSASYARSSSRSDVYDASSSKKRTLFRPYA
jgi:hypothetical protein